MLILAFFSRYNMNMHYYLVSPTRIVRADASSFTYSSEERLPTGMIVAIEVGKINTIGVILQEVRQPDFEVKPISKIVEEARQESIKWDREAIPRYQEQLRNGNLSGNQRILVRAQLLQTAAQLANFDMEDKVKSVKTLLSDAKEDIQNMIKETRQTAFDMVGYLSSSEVTNLLSGFDTTSFWDEGVASDTKTAATSFLTQIEQLGESLVKASGSFETIDTDSAEDFNNLLADVKQTWRGKNVSPNG